VCYINDTKIEVSEGEGFFVNSNTMHKEVPFDNTNLPVMTTVCFLPDFIGDCGSDLIFRKYIRPIAGDISFKGMKLSPEISWHSEMLDIIRNLVNGNSENSWGYELQCRNKLSELWYILSINLKKSCNSAATRKTAVNEKRLKEMLSFIHENYPAELSVNSIARAANISESECFRCFKSIIDKKPVTYLNEYRLKRAVDLLISTDMPITEICFACGFNHISYFGKLFRRYYGMTPRDFRSSN
jgi:AraC-like DNA-binding protein